MKQRGYRERFVLNLVSAPHMIVDCNMLAPWYNNFVQQVGKTSHNLFYIFFFIFFVSFSLKPPKSRPLFRMDLIHTKLRGQMMNFIQGNFECGRIITVLMIRCESNCLIWSIFGDKSKGRGVLRKKCLHVDTTCGGILVWPHVSDFFSHINLSNFIVSKTPQKQTKPF